MVNVVVVLCAHNVGAMSEIMPTLESNVCKILVIFSLGK